MYVVIKITTTAKAAKPKTSPLAVSPRDMNLYQLMALNRTIASNIELDAHLSAGNNIEASWSSTIIIYPKPGKHFSDKIEYLGLSFDVPVEYRQLKDCALILDYGKLKFKPIDMYGVRYGGAILYGKVEAVIENFPKGYGWYKTDPNTGIPFGKKSYEDVPEARYLFRAYNSPYIGLIVRGVFFIGGWRGIAAECGPESTYRVIDTGKIRIKSTSARRSRYLWKKLETSLLRSGFTLRDPPLSLPAQNQ
jgi:hypothetical protein